MRRLATTPIALALSAALGLAAAPALAEMPADSVFAGFAPNGDYVFALGGKVLDHAEVLYSERAVSFLVIAPELPSPILVNARARTVEKVHIMKVARREDGTVDILADASLDVVGKYRLEDDEVRFDLDAGPAALKSRPFLLGRQTGAVVKAYKPEYARGAAAYRPDAATVQALAAKPGAGDVTVRVYFGTWCPVCTRLVPRVLKVAEELGGRGIRFEYHGLPTPISDDPEAEQLDIHSVPTGVVFRGGREIGRLVGDQWQEPEKSLEALLAKG